MASVRRLVARTRGRSWPRGPGENARRPNSEALRPDLRLSRSRSQRPPRLRSLGAPTARVSLTVPAMRAGPGPRAATCRTAPIFGKDSQPSYGRQSTRASPDRRHRMLSPHTTGESSRRTAPATTLTRTVCARTSPDSKGPNINYQLAPKPFELYQRGAAIQTIPIELHR